MQSTRDLYKKNIYPQRTEPPPPPKKNGTRITALYRQNVELFLGCGEFKTYLKIFFASIEFNEVLNEMSVGPFFAQTLLGSICYPKILSRKMTEKLKLN